MTEKEGKKRRMERISLLESDSNNNLLSFDRLDDDPKCLKCEREREREHMKYWDDFTV